MIKKWLRLKQKSNGKEMPFIEENAVGIRVVRGKDWSWGDQDGGEGMVGTVVDPPQEQGALQPGQVLVIWDNGAHGKYRASLENAYDLAVFDTGPYFSKQGVACDECQKDIISIRWACLDCTLVSLCTTCYMNNAHDITHGFERLNTGNSKPVPVAARSVSKKTDIKGCFPGAIVVRGPDWDWEEQDGGEGQVGKIVDVENWQGKSKRNVVRVHWMKTGVSNIYRIGHKGKVDVKCVQPAVHGSYYTSHLPPLGKMDVDFSFQDNLGGALGATACTSKTSAKDAMESNPINEEPLNPKYPLSSSQLPSMCSTTSLVMPSLILPNVNTTQAVQHGPGKRATNISKGFQIGEQIRIIANKEQLMELQNDHGGFHPNMEQDLGKFGLITQKSEAGDLVVFFEDTKSSWTINPLAASKVVTQLVDGDTVQLLSNAALFKKIYQEDIGEWSEEYTKIIGLPGKIIKMYLDGNFKVAVGTVSLLVSKRLIEEKVLQISVTACPGQDTTDVTGQNDPMEDKTNIEGRLLRAAKEGDVAEVREILENHPLEVNTPALDETPLLAAITEESEEVIEHLLKQGASINIMDKNNHTAVHLALSLGNDRIIDLVLKAPDLDVDVLDAKYKLDYLQFAAVCGSIRGTEILVRRFPGLVKRTSSGPTPVHYAVFSSKELLQFLVKEAGFSVDSCDFDQRTPLHLSIISSNLDSCHLLVRLGCDLNAKDTKGNTVLHNIMASRGRKSLRDHRWYSIVAKRYLGRQKVQKDLNNNVLVQMCDDLKFKRERHETDSIIACWLILEGADPNITNLNGKTAFDVCYRPDILRVTKTFYDRCVVQKTKSNDDQMLPSLTSVSSDTQDCKLCRSAEPCMKFLPCEHIITCQSCADYFKKCYSCDAAIESLLNTNEISDCLVCDTNQAEVLFEPCLHTVVCVACSWRMKRCIYCKTPIGLMKNRDGTPVEHKFAKEDSKYASLLDTLKNLETKVKDMELLNTCSVCLDRPKNVVFLCGHGTCTMCSTTLGQCPICRSSIDKKIVLFQ